MSNLKIVFGTEDSFGNLDFGSHDQNNIDSNILANFSHCENQPENLLQVFEEAKKNLGTAYHCGQYNFGEDEPAYTEQYFYITLDITQDIINWAKNYIDNDGLDEFIYNQISTGANEEEILKGIIGTNYYGAYNAVLSSEGFNYKWASDNAKYLDDLEDKINKDGINLEVRKMILQKIEEKLKK